MEIDPNEYRYFAKGAANVLFRYTGTAPELQGRLLRVRLLDPRPDYVPCGEVYAYAQANIAPHFPELVPQTMVHVGEAGRQALAAECGFELQADSGAMLLPNLLEEVTASTKLTKNCVLHQGAGRCVVEFKPKWLDVPRPGRLCRNCAQARSKGQPRHFCSLDLVTPARVSRGVEDMLGRDGWWQEYAAPFAQFFRESSVLRRIQAQTLASDCSSEAIQKVASEEAVSAALLRAMTLRDCTMLVLIRESGSEPAEREAAVEANSKRYLVECTIVDVDLKAKSKYTHWAKVERLLAEAYTAGEGWSACGQ